MPSLGVSRSTWPVVAWIRLRLPERPAPLALIAGVPPPPAPPLDVLAPNPVPTDPRRRVFAFEEDHDGWVVRLVWDADDPKVLEAEYRAPMHGRRPTDDDVVRFWAAVKALVAPLGSLTVEAADPHPRPRART